MIKKFLHPAEELTPRALKFIGRRNASGKIFFLRFAALFLLWLASSAAAAFLAYKTAYSSPYILTALLLLTSAALFAIFLYYGLKIIRQIVKQNIELKLMTSEVEKNIQKTEESFKTLISNINEYVYSITVHNGRPEASFHSPKSTPITGYSPEELAEDINLWQKIIHPLDLENVKNMFRDAIAMRKPAPVEHRIITRDGALKWVSNYCRAAGDSAGNIVRLDGYIFDITEKKKNEEELNEYREHLEELVRLKTLELASANRALKDEIREKIAVTLELESLNKELEAFNHTVSHDLKAPLITINGYAGILLKKYAAEMDPEAVRLLNVIKLNALKGEQLIHDLLTLSYSDIKNIKRTPVDIKRVSMDIFDELNGNHPDRNINLSFGETPLIEADPDLIEHALVNFLSNAVKFTSSKKVAKIEIGGWLNDTQTIVYIKDNGVGFDMKYSDKLFDPFFRLHSRDEFEGTGVGLSIVRRIISRHGGQVWVESRPRKGSTFYFSLPFRTKDISSPGETTS